MPMPWRAASRTERKLTGFAIEQDAAGGRLLDAGNDLHQRRLAGAVFADQHVDRAGADAEIDLVEGDGARDRPC